MAGVGFELKKLFRSKKGYFQSVKAYTVSAVVTEGPMILNILMLFLMRYLIRIHGATVREQDIFLYTITYITIFSLIFSNTLLMFIDRYISDCIYQKQLKRIMPAFFGLIFWLVLIGGLIALIYLFCIPVDNFYRIVNLVQFCIMMIIWAEMAFLSAVKQYTKVMVGFCASVLVSVLTAMVLLKFTPLPLVMAALISTCLGYLVMMLMFLQQLLVYYPGGKLNIFQFFPALDKYKILVAIGFFMALGLYAHNFVVWTSEFKNQIWDNGVFCTKYDIPIFFATLTISPMLVRFVVSVEVNFYQKYREYFDGILYGGTLEDIRMTKKSLSKTLFREIAQMMEIQFFVTVLCATFLGNYLNRIGLDQEQTSIFRILCFGYCLFGLAKCLIILLLYFEDRAGALIGVMCFAGLSALFTWLFLKTEVAYWGSGFLAAAFVTAMYGAFRIRYFLDRLEYKVFLRQPLFYEEKKGVFTDLAEMAGKQEAHFKAEMEKRYQDKFEKRRQRRLRSRSLP
ncbi:MAG TPA: exopolysaccharide Pel transporter PelG [Candidatus Blautia faecigallinarum]|uniref:Exopolysaccharide Pel transporter PelG n=1 Tax=Candidatus Blautia faecigallinarum TaxID=2838488 RepID=A0A9D2DSY5_9FIRM|nr:exopolysaccharide Pel transporter PelG [Candidatus Blautia faecigallinarum]